MTRSLLWLVAMFFPIGSALAAPDLVPGDSFTYEQKGKSFTQVYEGANANGDHIFRVDDFTIVMDASMSFIERPGTKVEPHNGQLMLDAGLGFEVGKGWEISYVVIKSGGSTFEKVRKCKVTAHDASKSVQAGVFNAYRVDCSIETKGGSIRHSKSWYDAQTWRILEDLVGNNMDDLQISLKLVKLNLQPR